MLKQGEYNSWLKRKVNDSLIENIYSEPSLPNNYGGHHSSAKFSLYYQNNDIDIDIDIKNNSQYVDNDLDGTLSDYIEIYGSKRILLPPNCNQNHANFLFKKLIDSSIDLTIPIVSNNGDIIEEKLPMIDSSCKDIFYKFCYNNTSKK
jgi:hypothetical protein